MRPVYGEDGPPSCRGLPPNPPLRPFPGDVEVTDGYCDEAERAPGVQNGCAGRADDDPGPLGPLAALSQRGSDRKLLGTVAGPVMGLAPDDVPDAALLLLGPVARGTEVGLAPR